MLIQVSFPGGSADKESACNVGDLGLIPELGRSPGGGKGSPLQYSGLENSMDYTVHGILQAWILEWVAFPLSRGYSQPGIRPRTPALQAYSLPAEPQGKPKNTGVGSLSLLQQIFPIQELNWGLLHCRQILYQLSYQGSPNNVLLKCLLCLYLRH